MDSSRIAQSEIAALHTSVFHYCIGALRAMPGRKSIFFISPETNTSWYDRRDYAKIEMIAEEALHAGVVIHALNINGIEAPSPGPDGQLRFNYNPAFQDVDYPLAKQTGGIVLNNNFFVTQSGLGSANELLKGYYLLSYDPPKRIAAIDWDGWHSIRIKARRSGSSVFTRNGFYGKETPPPVQSIPRNISLTSAIYSPFQYNDLKVTMNSSYAHSSQSGYFLRSWLHIDPQELAFIDEKDGGHSLSLEAITLTTDSEGTIQDYKNLNYTFYIKNADLSWVKRYGVDFSLYLPVKKPESYSVRAAIRDHVSGKIGSAYQYLEIPNLKKGKLTLSSIFLFDRPEDAFIIRDGNLGGDNGFPTQALEWKAVRKSPALRNYLPGDGFNFLAILYNTKTNEGRMPELESRYVLFKDGKMCLEGEIDAVVVQNASDLARIPIIKRFSLGSHLEAGDYILQLQVREKESNGKFRQAAQSIDFQIRRGTLERVEALRK